MEPNLALIGSVVLLTEWRLVRWSSSDGRDHIYVEVERNGYVVLCPGSPRDLSETSAARTHSPHHSLSQTLSLVQNSVNVDVLADRVLNNIATQWFFKYFFYFIF